jgi:prepilin-type N-terminal cleavage/methylation domain-containing protein
MRSESGFTLIELLIVIIVVAVLAAIAIPLYLNQRERAKDSAVKEGTHAIQVGVQTYSVDHDDLYPASWDVAADSALGEYVDPWPLNPFTQELMADDSDYSLGDFSYEPWAAVAMVVVAADYDHYSLKGWTSDPAKPFVAVDDQPAGDE